MSATIPADEAKRIIETIGPALRGLLAEGSRLPAVAFDDSATPPPEAETSPLLFAMPPSGEAPATLVDRLTRSVTDYRAAHGALPHCIRVENVGLFTAAQVAASAGRVGRVEGKIAFITGAAQGFGLEIAQDLAAQGATVALADVNRPGAARAADDLCRRFGPGRAMGLGVDVTSGPSIAAALHEVVRRVGGLDIFISNAGVLRAGGVTALGVTALSEADFDFVTAVNYKGYFLCVQKAAPLMALTRRVKPDYFSDIIQINSKSGLEGSHRNSAYAGSKFGGIGLTQSFALELIADGIKVNAICPGNFLDGPLWSDPQRGLFVQYLQAGKIPGARTVDDVRRAYEAKVPMGRGCQAADVMKAVYYLIDQQYETGQAVPVTGGQAMLR